MKILLLCHTYLPHHTAGTEVYTAQLAAHLRDRGHEVSVFCTEKDISLPNLVVRQREHRGIAVTELINNLFYAEFPQTWDQPEIARRFGECLDRVLPDVVHVQHLMYLSIGCVEEAARRWIPVLFTLHDFWLQCARHGQRVHADSSICHTIDFARCGECLTSFKWRQSPLQRSTAEVIAALRDKTGINLAPAAKGAANLFAAREGEAAERPAPAGPGDSEQLALQVAERDRAFRERVVPLVFRFLSPSRFLRQQFIEWGIPEEKIQFLRTGIDPEHFKPRPRTHSVQLRVAFIGTLAPHKGAHVLLDAWERLSPELRARGRLELIGPQRHNPSYVRELKARSQSLGVAVRAGLSRAKVAEALGSIDLLVVPSVWYENSPLVILEALAARTPLLVSDIGGMAELVTEGRTGFHFRVGDAGHLAEQLAHFLLEPEALAKLYREPEPIKQVEQDAEQIEEVYFEALDHLRARMNSEAPPPPAGAQ
jgi:glycosyltransferase involved in cell wall biosynthesis